LIFIEEIFLLLIISKRIEKNNIFLLNFGFPFFDVFKETIAIYFKIYYLYIANGMINIKTIL